MTAVLALFVGFGFWWNYFDAVGREIPRRNAWTFSLWSLAHLPLTASIAAAGAGMVSLVEHADSSHTPAETAWLLCGASASMLLWVGVLVVIVDYDDEGRADARAALLGGLAVGVVASLAIGWWAPQPWLLALALAFVHAAMWIWAFLAIARARVAAGLGAPDLV